MALEETERYADPTRPGSGGASGQATIDDLGDSLSAIRGHYQKPLINLLLDIQETKIQSSKSMKFVQELECLFLLADNNTRSLGARPTEPRSARPTATFVRERINAFQEGEYVALSYTWEPYLQSETYGQYYVEPRNRDGRPKKSEVRDSVFGRIIKYMNRFNLSYLWIDKECIAQEDSEEKEIAFQAMDQVYNCSIHPIGLLYQPIQSIAELELLARLMTWDFIEKSGSGFELDPEFPEESKCNTLELLEAIVSDVWWTRAWIYQENYRGGTNMKLLIPHRISQEDYHNRGPYVELFGDIPGEIILESTKFHEAATAFCLAFEPPDRLTKAKKLVRDRAKRYTLLLEQLDINGHSLATKSMSPLIISDIENRHLSKPFDRLPIIANCCQYSVRLDSTELAKGGHSVSLAILALFLLNGDILHNGPHDRTHIPGKQSVTEFLNAQAFNRYSPPRLSYGLTYNKSCRLIDVELTGDGLRTRGHLWKLGSYINTSRLPKISQHPEDDDRLGRGERLVLRLLAKRIKYYKGLREDIYGFLKCVDAPEHGDSFAKEYQRYMTKELVTAVNEGKRKRLRLAALWRPDGGYSPYRAIFICDRSEPGGSPSYAFTASQEGESNDDRRLINDIDKHVSLAVDFFGENERTPFLYTRRWMHGLCFFYGCPRIEVVFPWPRALSEI